ncbi:MAG: SPOR domain-containing protein [Nevskiaceae bacterium]|nr:MAG: SPOR domain-containing protein [Nevskiaceae bacterium]TBR74033.1 MAG: SPOR domain-containing protein [Nevskiaceae bacterium]
MTQPVTQAAVQAPVVADPTLRLARLVGTAMRLREGRSTAAAEGMTLRSGDILELGPDAKAALQVGVRGILQMGGGSRLVVENQPAVDQSDAPTIFNLQHGELHAVWAAQMSPAYVYADNWRVTLDAGEYFVRKEAAPAGGADRSRVCVADGRAVFHAIDSARNGTLVSGTCGELGGDANRLAPFPANRQLALRNAFELPEAVAPALVLSGAQATAPAAADKVAVAPVVVAQEGALATPIQARPMTPSATPAPAPILKARSQDLTPSTVGSPTLPQSAETDAADRGGWAINVASYDEPAAAERQRAQLTGAGYRAVVVPAQINGRTWYRVQLPGFDSREDARARIASLDSTLTRGETLWVTRKR